MNRRLNNSIMVIGAVTCMLGMATAACGQVRSFQVSKGGTLEVKLDGGDILVSTSTKNEVTVRGEPVDNESSNNVNVTQTGTTIRVTSRGDDGRDREDKVRITIPSQFNLRLETSHGEVAVDGKLVGHAEAETGAGNISLDDVDGNVDLSTSGGDVKTGTVDGDGTVRTSGGDIEVKSTTGRLDVKTSGGDIRIGNVGKTLRAGTSGGDVTIGDVGGEAKVATSGGNIRTGKVNGKVSLATSGGDIELNGGNGNISAATSGGNVNIRNVSGSVDASSSGGDINAELRPSGKGRSRLTTAAGNITLFLPEDAKASIDARIRVQGYWRGQHKDYTIQSDFTADKSSQNEEDQEIYAHYTLNGGGEQITLETVNSDIQIRKLRSGK
jgi:DUF4097 and DUF4098 domain-containing protein YvlB